MSKSELKIKKAQTTFCLKCVKIGKNQLRLVALEKIGVRNPPDLSSATEPRSREPIYTILMSK